MSCNALSYATFPGAQAEGNVAKPEPPKGGEAHSVCYATFALPDYVIRNIDKKLRMAAFFYVLDEKGTLRKVSGAVVGNKVAAWRTGKRIDEIFGKAAWECDKTLFITLTHGYVKTEQGRQESWKFFQKDLPRYLRKLKKKGMKDFIVVKEAHRDGGCHAHLLCQWQAPFLTFTHKGVRRIANKALRDFLKDNWAGDVDVMAMRDNDVAGYLKKYLGKYSHVEDALRRAKRDWSGIADEKHKDADCKKLWTLYYITKMKVRRFTCNVRRLADDESAKPTDLVKSMNNSTAENAPKIIKQVLIPWHIKFNPAFEPCNGAIKSDSREYMLAMSFLYPDRSG